MHWGWIFWLLSYRTSVNFLAENLDFIGHQNLQVWRPFRQAIREKERPFTKIFIPLVGMKDKWQRWFYCGQSIWSGAAITERFPSCPPDCLRRSLGRWSFNAVFSPRGSNCQVSIDVHMILMDWLLKSNYRRPRWSSSFWNIWWNLRSHLRKTPSEIWSMYQSSKKVESL